MLHAATNCSANWLPPELLYRFQVGLRALFGRDWALAVGNSPASPAFMLTFPLQQPVPVPLPTPMEVLYG